MYKLPLGKSIALKSDNFYGLIDEMVALGFETVDTCMCAGGFWFEEAEIEEAKKRLAYVRSTSLFLNGIHIPYGNQWDISAAAEENRKISVENVRKIVELTREFQPKTYILHGSFEPIMDDERVEKISALIKSVKELRSLGVSIAIENLPRTCLMNTSSEILSVLKETGDIPLCVDVNHFLREETHEGVAAIAPYVVTTHISDHDYANERHWLPGKGKINFNKTLAALEKAGYNGPFTYELEATLTEIKHNYDEIFATYNR